MKCVDLTKSSIKILGLHFSYNKNLKDDKNFQETLVNIQRVLQVWKMRELTLKGRIIIFKTLAISKIICVGSQTLIPDKTIQTLCKLQQDFIWRGKRPKINHETLCNSYESGGLKNIDIPKIYNYLGLRNYMMRIFMSGN